MKTSVLIENSKKFLPKIRAILANLKKESDDTCEALAEMGHAPFPSSFDLEQIGHWMDLEALAEVNATIVVDVRTAKQLLKLKRTDVIQVGRSK